MADERRRRWDDETRLKILSEAFALGANTAEVARHHDVSTGQIYTWRRKLLAAHVVPTSAGLPDPGFAEAVMMKDDRPPRTDVLPALIVELVSGRRVSIFSSASPAAITATLKTLR